jgi:hypothetical protein
VFHCKKIVCFVMDSGGLGVFFNTACDMPETPYDATQGAIRSGVFERDFERVYGFRVDALFPRVGPYRSFWKQYEMFVLARQ